MLTSVTTAELISRYSTYLFKGKWYTTPKNITTQVVNGVEELISVEINTDTIDVDKTINGTFGYNYGYPIYKFNKLGTNVVADGLKCSDIAYSLKTGTGEDDSDLSSRYTDLSSVESDKYDNAYKIPHLGVFSALHGLQGASRNYVIIYDITGKASRKEHGAMIEWNGICSTSEINEGFAKTGAFNGVLVTNKNLTNTFDANSTDYICTIEGLNKSGLFNEIGKSYIADITLGSFGAIVPAAGNNLAINGLTNSGAIGNKVVDETIINNIKFADDSVIVGNNFGVNGLGNVTSDVVSC